MITRAEVDVKDTWALEDLYPSDEAWEEEFKELSEEFPKIEAFRGHLGESAEQLLMMQKMYDAVNLKGERLYVYANQKWHQDTGNGTYQAMAGKAAILVNRISESCSYIEPEILSLPDGTIEHFLEDRKSVV